MFLSYINRISSASIVHLVRKYRHSSFPFMHRCRYLPSIFLRQKINFSLMASSFQEGYPIRLKVGDEKSFSNVQVSQSDGNDLSNLEEFDKAYEIVWHDFVQEDNIVLTDAVNWCSKVFHYNLRNGKRIRGLTVLEAFQFLSQNNDSSNGLRSASILGWCTEMLQAFFLILDDIMDQSSFRRGEPCWYKKPEVGLCAINDALLLQGGIYKLVLKHFGNCDFYNNVLHEFLEVTQKTIYGQCLDMLSNPPHQKPRFECFTRERYDAIVEHKTSHYTFCLPVHLGMHLAGNCTLEDFQATRLLCLKLGLLFQIQDDYLDCYGDSELTGKVGSDISQGKCTWFAFTFFENATDAMKKEMMEHYGIDNQVSIAKVKRLYEALSMKKKFMDCENQLYSEIVSLIPLTLSNNSLKDLFHYLLHKMYKRKK